jgi:Protein of unknown function (DUF2934)
MAWAAAKRTNTVVLGETNLPLEEAIRIRAREIWFQYGAQDGSALVDWLEAEKEILDERTVMAKCSRCGAETTRYFSGVPTCVGCDKSNGVLVDRPIGEGSKKPPNAAQSMRPVHGRANSPVRGK